MLGACAKGLQWTRCLEIFSSKADATAVASLLTACDSWRVALRLLRAAEEVNVVAYNALIDSSRRWRLALLLFEEALEWTPSEPRA